MRRRRPSPVRTTACGDRRTEAGADASGWTMSHLPSGELVESTGRVGLTFLDALPDRPRIRSRATAPVRARRRPAVVSPIERTAARSRRFQADGARPGGVEPRSATRPSRTTCTWESQITAEADDDGEVLRSAVCDRGVRDVDGGVGDTPGDDAASSRQFEPVVSVHAEKTLTDLGAWSRRCSRFPPEQAPSFTSCRRRRSPPGGGVRIAGDPRDAAGLHRATANRLHARRLRIRFIDPARRLALASERGDACDVMQIVSSLDRPCVQYPPS